MKYCCLITVNKVIWWLWGIFYGFCTSKDATTHTLLINSLLRWRRRQRVLNECWIFVPDSTTSHPKRLWFPYSLLWDRKYLFILNEVLPESMTFKTWIKVNHALFIVPRWDMRIDRYDMQMKSVYIMESGWRSCDVHPALSLLSNVSVAKPLRVRYKIPVTAYWLRS